MILWVLGFLALVWVVSSLASAADTINNIWDDDDE